MELHQFEYVLAVEKHRHFSRAAEAISISQSALSQQIRKLEEELGIVLFERTTRSIQPTPAGLEFVQYAKRIIGEVERVKQAMQAHRTLERGKVTIGAVPILGYLGLTPAIAGFRKSYPGIDLEIREATSDHLLQWLHAGDIDLALTTFSLHHDTDEHIHFLPLLEDQLVLVTSHYHPLAQRKKIDLSEAAGEPFLAIKASHFMRNICEHACEEAGFTPTIIVESSQVETICGLVEEGMGVALFTHRVAKCFPRSRIAVVRLKKPFTKITGIALSRNHLLTPAANAFCRFLQEWQKEHEWH
ncbi:transcriptional regulator [Brevibacillus borstelensis AK1]|uniref:Transcriptional regulator n=1 Tax=Brevibacillus borstelensis AK1 TaxID=1300222 RepID=M8DMD2_9BACL|nr:LysR family transcriptional regulator [Brevibacillus borstelensis]EMT54803.1 transcriptional regulator [Brevibacillus borstelensis AK1]MCC0565265.1 LysR family transcriptional regulator [Brevibacillus borstelensis]